ncbi:hypothetical protein HDE_10920 [Halotydeus destructor]|nr:hypothetical protein HDE_10920 [Halotydeus destructor]
MNSHYDSSDPKYDVYLDGHLDEYWAMSGVPEYADLTIRNDDTSEVVLDGDDLEELKRGNYEIILFYPLASFKYFLMTLWNKVDSMIDTVVHKLVDF